MRPLLFIPSKNDSPKPDADSMRLLGLDGLHKRADMIRIQEGPEHQSGWLFSWLSPTFTQLLYNAEKQDWIPAASVNGSQEGRYWVGLWKGKPPTEEDLRKPDASKAQLVRLGNGENWRISTPQTLEKFPIFADGGVQWVVDEQFNWLGTELDAIRATSVTTWTDEENKIRSTFTFDDTRHFLFLCQLLAINYRITPEIVVALRLFNDASVRQIVAGLMGMDLGE